MDVIAGASFVFATVIVKDCVSFPPLPSETITITLLAPTWSFVGVHSIMPIAASMDIPVGNDVKI